MKNFLGIVILTFLSLPIFCVETLPKEETQNDFLVGRGLKMNISDEKMNEKFIQFSKYDHLETLDLSKSKGINGESIKHIVELKNLKSLNLVGTNIDEQVFVEKVLPKMPNLKVAISPKGTVAYQNLIKFIVKIINKDPINWHVKYNPPMDFYESLTEYFKKIFNKEYSFEHKNGMIYYYLNPIK